eukprot:NODE_14324_length_1115_cov_8.552632.p1 GENE.NODE_14324_length_1115_cov_8.552632~~NODE_14324_length_1115_cov_8.552632.p1  ORF type:complete len:296 (+),score=69.23 NODE_14324_length_1115_cov_8.552632:107-889(+)
MVAVLSIGDCELLTLRRASGPLGEFEGVFRTEMQRIDQNAQTPLQLARVDERIDPHYDESVAVDVIEKGSAVHCVSVFEGDLLIMGSDGVFDNLFLDEVVQICNKSLRPSLKAFAPTAPAKLSHIAKVIVNTALGKTGGETSLPGETPIGRGGKADDTSVVVAEIVEWTETHRDVWTEIQRKQLWDGMLCGGVPPWVQCQAPRGPCDPCEFDDRMCPSGNGAPGGRLTHVAHAPQRLAPRSRGPRRAEAEDAEYNVCAIC